MASSSTSSFPKSFKYDVFLSFRGEDTRTNFIDHLYSALEQKSIYTYKDDERIKKGKRISDELIRSIEDSRFYIIDLEELHMAHEYAKLTSIQLEGLKLSALDLGPSPMLTFINIRNSKLRTLDVSLVPNLHVLFLSECKDLVELHLPSRSKKLNSLRCTNSMLRTLDLGLTPNLKELILTGCHNLVELHIPIGCLTNIVYLELTGCLAFTSFLFRLADQIFGIQNESLELHFTLQSYPFHPDNNSLKFEFTRFHKDDLPSLITILEELISVGLCACTKLERFSRSIGRLQRKYN